MLRKWVWLVMRVKRSHIADEARESDPCAVCDCEEWSCAVKPGLFSPVASDVLVVRFGGVPWRPGGLVGSAISLFRHEVCHANHFLVI